MFRKIILPVVLMICVCSAAEEKRYGESDYALCYELFDAMKMEQQFQKSIDLMVELQVKSNPMLQMFRPEMESFFQHYASYQALKKHLARIYLEEFTADDIREFIRFYRSPAGAKLAERNPELAAKAANLGQTMVQDNLPELQKILSEKIEKMGRQMPGNPGKQP